MKKTFKTSIAFYEFFKKKKIDNTRNTPLHHELVGLFKMNLKHSKY